MPVTGRDVLELWKRLFKWILPSGSRTTDEWRRILTPVLIGCLFCAFFKAVLPVSLSWVEYVPAGLITEFALIYLCIRIPFAIPVSFQNRAAFPIFGLWLPFIIQLLFSRLFTTVSAITKEYFHFTVPQIQSPFAANRGLINTLACVIQTMVILITAWGFDYAFEKYRWPRQR